MIRIYVTSIIATVLSFIVATTAGLDNLGNAHAEQPCNPKVKPTTFEQFKNCTYQEPDTGIWIVDGDLPIADIEALKRFYDALVASPPDKKVDLKSEGRPVSEHIRELIVHRLNGVDAVWPVEHQCNVSYCVSQQSTGARYQPVLDAMRGAGQAWSQHAGVRFVHNVAEDRNCTAANRNVDFDVQVVSNQPFLARAFFPLTPRQASNILINTTAFNTSPPLTLEGVLRHELGHTIGFRHEHTRPEAATCFEDNNWRVLTPYDSASVMHYPQCNGSGDQSLSLSALDIRGSASLYGSKLACEPPPRRPVSCSVFDDGYSNIAGPSDAIFFNARRQACIPDGTASGTCRKWFGKCTSTSSNDGVNFFIFNDGEANKVGPSDAIYIRSNNQACIPDGTATGTCRRWFGPASTANGARVDCALFFDGYGRVLGPTGAIYSRAPNELCMPDGSPTGACRKWFGRCRTP